MTEFRKSRFTEHIIRENALEENGFGAWVFRPGMLFHAENRWWGDLGKRERPHEGVDFCLYRDGRDRMLRLDAGTKIPAMYDGVVVGIVDDFLGQSVMMEHAFPGCGDSRFYSIFGHTLPDGGLCVGKSVKAGDIIATVAEPPGPKADMLPHLHLSLGWTSKATGYDQLDWMSIGCQDTLVLSDPVLVLDRPYLVLEREGGG